MPKPRTIDELREFLETHQDDGKINGYEVASINEDVVEFAGGFVPGDIYNKTILRSAALSFSKSHAGTFALTQFIADPSVNNGRIIGKPAEAGTYSTEFPFYIAAPIYNAATAIAQSIDFTQSDLITYALKLFIENPNINAFYEKYINDLSQRFGHTRDYVELKIYGWRRYQSRKTRYDMSLAAGEFIDRRKLP